MRKITVLVVDDSAVVGMRLTSSLEELGHKVVATAKTGEQAIELYTKLRPDLVTMDITMPDMDGIEATRRIIKEFPEAMVIMVTSHGQEQMVIEALSVGARGYVLKPFSKIALQDHIDKIFQHYSDWT